ncbi:anthranilate synthase component I [Halorutilales archaeon Cl-col2-1]
MSEFFDVSEDEYVERIESGADVVKLSAEVETDAKPLEVYSALRGDYSFLLESADKNISALRQVSDDDSGADTGARYSFVGFDPVAVVRIDGRSVEVESLSDVSDPITPDTDVVEDGEVKEGHDPLDALRAVAPDVETAGFDGEDRQAFEGGLMGYLAYDVVDEVWIDGRDKESSTPDAEFVVSTHNVVFDHAEDQVSVVFTPLETDSPRQSYRREAEKAREAVSAIEEHEPRSPQGFEVLDSRSGGRDVFEEAVDETREHILDGDIYQAVVSRQREIDVRGDIRDFYSKLREINPSPYMYLVEFDGRSVVGSSPETLLSVHGDRVKTNPIAGTCPRGETAVEDRRLAGEMLSDEKELSEHVMLVDLGRNDVRRVSESGSIDVEEFMSVVQYSHVQHIESTVAGDLRDGKDAFDATRSIFPAGTLSGAPKIRAMEIIDRLETSPRDVYGGGVGYYSWTGDADLAIAIRTATFEERENHDTKTMTVQAGAGIVADSDPESEFDETEGKMDALLTALDDLSVSGSRDKTETQEVTK